MTFADKLKWHRTRAGLSQRGLAKAIGVTNGAVAAWERGLSEPRHAAFTALCRLFGVTAEALEGDVPRGPRDTERIAV